MEILQGLNTMTDNLLDEGIYLIKSIAPVVEANQAAKQIVIDIHDQNLMEKPGFDSSEKFCEIEIKNAITIGREAVKRKFSLACYFGKSIGEMLVDRCDKWLDNYDCQVDAICKQSDPEVKEEAAKYFEEKYLWESRQQVLDARNAAMTLNLIPVLQDYEELSKQIEDREFVWAFTFGLMLGFFVGYNQTTLDDLSSRAVKLKEFIKTNGGE